MVVTLSQHHPVITPMEIISPAKIRSFLGFSLELFVLSSFLFSQLSLAGIFLYPGSHDSSSPLAVRTASADTLDPWHDTAWNYRKAVIIDHAQISATDQADFPVLVSFADPDLKTQANGGKVQNANGYDIVFANEAGDARLDHEIESYDAATGAITMWVKIPVLSASVDTSIYMYYGNPFVATSQEHIASVWDANFKMVQHMDQDPSGAGPQILDSTLNANNGTSGGTMTSGDSVIGKAGKAVDFDGVDDNIAIPDSNSLDVTNAITLESWVKYGGYVHQWSPILWKGTGTTYALNLGTTGSTPTVMINNDGLSAPSNLQTGAWTHIAVTYNKTSMLMYINGEQVGSKAKAVSIATDNGVLTMGTVSSAVWKYRGVIDEARVSGVARSSDWIRTEYNNQFSPSTFLSLSSEEGYTDHLSLSGSAAQTAGGSQTITLTAVNASGSVNTAYGGDRAITLSGADTIGAYAPAFTDKDGSEVPFGSVGTLAFTNGVAETQIVLYRAGALSIDVTDGTSSSAGGAAYDLDLTVSPAALESFLLDTPASVTSESPFVLTLIARDLYGNTTTEVSSAATLSVSQGILDTPSLPVAEFTDDGSYAGNVTLSEIYGDASVLLTATSGGKTGTRNLMVNGVSHGSFIPPRKPVIDPVPVASGDFSHLPESISQIAIARTSDFSGAFWQDFDPEKYGHFDENTEMLYLKFRTRWGAVSDMIVYVPQASPALRDGDIVQTAASPDVYVIKIKNGKLFKRLILSPRVFTSYQHLRWENIRTIAPAELGRYKDSSLVRVAGEGILYFLSPHGDTGQREIFSGTCDEDGVYEINASDRDAYAATG